jgi:hypothetical protein
LEVVGDLGFVDEGDRQVFGGDVACSSGGDEELVCAGAEAAGSLAGFDQAR